MRVRVRVRVRERVRVRVTKRQEIYTQELKQSRSCEILIALYEHQDINTYLFAVPVGATILQVF